MKIPEQDNLAKMIRIKTVILLFGYHQNNQPYIYTPKNTCSRTFRIIERTIVHRDE
jgi:hypothetical protein